MPYGWGNRSPHWGMNHEAYAVCHRTGTSEWRNYFTSTGWFNIGAILNERGFSAAEIECILLSEWMGHVVEMRTKDWGSYNSADFEKVLGVLTPDPQTFRAAASIDMLDDLEELENQQEDE